MFPVVRAQGPAMRESNDSAGLGTPVLVVDLCAISGCKGRHDWDSNDKGEGLWVVVWLSGASRNV